MTGPEVARLRHLAKPGICNHYHNHYLADIASAALLNTMADIALDYGSAEADPANSSSSAVQDEAMDDGSAPQANTSRFYALPTDQAIEAGAQRPPAPLTSSLTLDDAALMGAEQPSPTPDPPAVESGSDIRLETLLIEGNPITQLSTSRLFAYLTHYGAQPLGLEWIDDMRCKIVFADERSARIALEYLCPPTGANDEMKLEDGAEEGPLALPNLDTLLEYDPDSWHSEFITSLVTPRKAHRIPAKLYTHVERQAALSEAEDLKRTAEAVSSLPDDVPEIYREMEAEDRKRTETREVRDLKKLRSSLWLRHAVTDVDKKENRASTRSQWYKRHGFEAGREIVPKLLQVGEVRESVELFPDYKPSESKGRGRDRDGRRSMLDQLDSELDQHVARRGNEEGEPERREGEMMADAVQARGGRRRRDDEGDLMDRVDSRRNRHRNGERSDGRWGHDGYEQVADEPRSGRGRRSRVDAMDEELDELQRSRHNQHQRELSPGRRPPSYAESRHDGGRVKTKGRGRMKAPGLSSFDDRWESEADAPKGSLAARMGGGKDLLGRMGGQSLADRFS